MDFAIGARSVFVMMVLFAKDGSPKLVPSCTYPLTGVGCVDRIYTELSVFDLVDGDVHVRETFGADMDGLRARLDMSLHG